MANEFSLDYSADFSRVAFTPSSSGTVVLTGASGVITDANGDTWTLPSTQVININGVPTSSATTVMIAYVSGVVWALVTSGLWYGTTSSTGPWLPSTGTTTPPITVTPSVDNTTVLAGASGVITDTIGNSWTISSTGVVALNGIADTGAGMSRIVYVNGVVWCQYGSGNWWGKVSPNEAWSPPAGAATIPTASANGATVLAGASGVITDKGGNLWTLSSAGVVTINGTADTTTSGMTKILYVGGTVWCQYSSGLWWGRASISAAWLPTSGTMTHPMESPSGTVVLAGASGVITDAAGNEWTLPSSQFVNVNGSPISSVTTVKIAYVSGVLWVLVQSSSLWYGTTSPTGPWTPTNGTSTSPL